MIAQKYYQLVYSFVMALLMSGIMSLVITCFNLGFTEYLLQRWLKAWGFGFLVAFPAVFIVSKLVTRIVDFVIIDNAQEMNK